MQGSIRVMVIPEIAEESVCHYMVLQSTFFVVEPIRFLGDFTGRESNLIEIPH